MTTFEIQTIFIILLLLHVDINCGRNWKKILTLCLKYVATVLEKFGCSDHQMYNFTAMLYCYSIQGGTKLFIYSNYLSEMFLRLDLITVRFQNVCQSARTQALNDAQD